MVLQCKEPGRGEQRSVGHALSPSRFSEPQENS